MHQNNDAINLGNALLVTPGFQYAGLALIGIATLAVGSKEASTAWINFYGTPQDRFEKRVLETFGHIIETMYIVIMSMLAAFFLVVYVVDESQDYFFKLFTFIFIVSAGFYIQTQFRPLNDGFTSSNADVGLYNNERVSSDSGILLIVSFLCLVFMWLIQAPARPNRPNQFRDRQRRNPVADYQQMAQWNRNRRNTQAAGGYSIADLKRLAPGNQINKDGTIKLNYLRHIKDMKGPYSGAAKAEIRKRM